MPQWYISQVCRAHHGAGVFDYVRIGVFAANVCEVLNRHKKMPGIKKDNFKDIVPLSQMESSELERRIAEEGRIPLSKAKKTWYYLDLAV